MSALRPLRVLATLWCAWLVCFADAPALAGPIAPCVSPVDSVTTPQRLLDGDRLTCLAQQTGHGSGDYWATIDVPAADARAAYIGWGSLWQDRVTLWLRYADGSTRTMQIGSERAGDWLTIGAVYRVPLPQTDVALVRIVARVNGAANLRGVLVDARLSSATEIRRSELIIGGLYGAFFGLAIALLVYNAMIWSALRHAFQLAYCAMVVSTVAYAFTSSGIAAMVMPWLDNNDRLRANYLLLALVAAFATEFARTFLGIRGRRVAAVHAFGLAQLALATASFALLAPWHVILLDRLYILSLGFQLIVVALFACEARWQHSAYLKAYLFAWAAPILLYVARLAHGFELLPHSLLLDNSTLVAMCIEALLSSTAMTTRIRKVRNDYLAAMAGEAEARQLAEIDPLTGLLNRRALLRLACPAEPASYRLILLDIDHFKQVNDTAGHEQGDRVLIHLARILTDEVRGDARVARMGGEEFAILFPASARERRTYAALLRRVRQTIFASGVQVTLSMGIADGMLGTDEAAWRELYRRADAALYAAKRGGRDRLVQNFARAPDSAVA